MKNIINAELSQLTIYEIIHRIKRKIGYSKKIKRDNYYWTLSTGRVGTNTLAELLSNIENLEVKHEPYPKLYGLSKVAHDLKFTEDNFFSEALEATRDIKHGWNTNGYLETGPHFLFLAPHLKKTFLTSKFIWLIRNPIKVVNSGVKRDWYNGNYTDRWKIIPDKKDLFYSRWNSATVLQKNIWHWCYCNNWILNYFNSLEEDEKLNIKSELLFKNDKDTMYSLFEFVGAQFPGTKKINRILGQKLNSSKVSSQEIVWTKEDYSLLEELGERLLNKFQYSW